LYTKRNVINGADGCGGFNDLWSVQKTGLRPKVGTCKPAAGGTTAVNPNFRHEIAAKPYVLALTPPCDANQNWRLDANSSGKNSSLAFSAVIAMGGDATGARKSQVGSKNRQARAKNVILVFSGNFKQRVAGGLGGRRHDTVDGTRGTRFARDGAGRLVRCQARKVSRNRKPQSSANGDLNWNTPRILGGRPGLSGNNP